MIAALVLVLGLVLAYQTYVSVLLLRAGLSRLQLGFQLALTWLLPLVGAAVCHWFLRLHEVNERPRPNRAAETLETAETFPTHHQDS